MLHLDNHRLVAETRTLSAIFEDGRLISLRSRLTDDSFLLPEAASKEAPLYVVYPSGQAVPIGGPGATISYHQHSDWRVDITIQDWEGDGLITISEQRETGELLIEPSVFTTHPGVLACRWSLAGIAENLQLVAPFYQGSKLALDDPLIARTRWEWPVLWEAALAILQGQDAGFWVHTRDTRALPKSLQVGSETQKQMLGFDSETPGPVDDNLSAGGFIWRLNVYQGDWTVPAGSYRDWLWQAYNLKQRQEARPAWMQDVTLAFTWCESDPAFLDALAQKVKPSHTLLHLAHWRTDPYDENYPTFEPSPEAKLFVAKGKQMGFHIFPHMNPIDMDPTHPYYQRVNHFQYRDIHSKRVLGWAWDEQNHTMKNVPASPQSLFSNRHKKVMVKIHPGASFWRSLLIEQVHHALNELQHDCTFLDVTLATQNVVNSMVEQRTPTLGMLELLDMAGELNNGIVLGGEGLNEMTMQSLSFAQAHLFRSAARSIEGLERAGGCPLNAFLFSGLSRTIGYTNISGKNEDQEMRHRVHVSLGAIPTLSELSVEEILHPNAFVQHIFNTV